MIELIEGYKKKTSKGFGLAYVVVGQTDAGKTTFVKNRFASKIKNKERIYAYDLDGEYGNGIYPGDWDEFTEGMWHRRNSLIILEEATMEMSNRSDLKPVRKSLVKKSHHNNLIIFCFHSIHRIPDSIVNFIDGWYIFRTLDNPTQVHNKYKNMTYVYEAWEVSRDCGQGEYVFAEKPGFN